MKTLLKLFAIIMFFSFTNCITARKTPAKILGFRLLKEETVEGEKNEYIIEVYEKGSEINNTKKVFT